MELGRLNGCVDGIENKTEREKMCDRCYCRLCHSAVSDPFSDEDMRIDREMFALRRNRKISSVGLVEAEISRFYEQYARTVMELGTCTLCVCAHDFS